jgi:hypothetical protein
MLLPHATWGASEGHFVRALQACVHYFSAYPRIMHINKCCKSIGKEHQLANKKHEGKRNILYGRKRGSMRNKGVKKLKNSIQQKK